MRSDEHNTHVIESRVDHLDVPMPISKIHVKQHSKAHQVAVKPKRPVVVGNQKRECNVGHYQSGFIKIE